MLQELQRIVLTHRMFTKERNWDQFQNPKNLSMALAVEAAELAEIFMWLSEEKSKTLQDDQYQAASDEIADIFLYLLRIADELGVDLVKATDAKMEKNRLKYPVEKGRVLAQKLI